MKTIGMLGGMSWESTASYYRALNEGVKARLGGLHSAKLCLVSVDFAEIEALQRTGDWDSAGAVLAEAARQVERGGADFLLICTNTMHKAVASIAAPRLKEDGVTRVGLLGTRFTMAEDFYKGRLEERFGIEVLVPDTPTQERLSSIIYDELCLGVIEDASRRVYLEAIAELARRGAQGVILGCTEIALLVQQPHTDTQLYDTTALHAHAAIEAALAE